MDMDQTFSQKIIFWYQQHKRELPWRELKDPYKIWLSEIILQQTRVAQGLPYYELFIKHFPTVHSLASASEQQVLKLWQGLGYYSRARNLHFTAKYISQNLDGNFPTSYKELIKLKGIGDYTASAIASFSFDESVATVDGNVYRVLTRYFGIETPIDLPKTKNEIKKLVTELIDKERPGIFNQAIMEFGALQCTPSNPKCNACPFKNSCVALEKNKISTIPAKSKKTEIKKRFFNYLVFQTPNNQTLIQKREKNDIWKHLYEFPLIESDFELNFEEFITSFGNIHPFIQAPIEIKLLNPVGIKHKLTHQDLNIKFWEIKLSKLNEPYFEWQEISKYPFPVIIHNFINSYLKDY